MPRCLWGFPHSSVGKESACSGNGQEDPLKRRWQPTPVFLPEAATWAEETGRLQPVGSQSQTQLKQLSTCMSDEPVWMSVTDLELFVPSRTQVLSNLNPSSFHLGPGITIYLVVQDWNLRVVLDVPLSLTASLPKSYPLSSSVSSISMMLKIHFSISISAILTWAISHYSLCTHYLWTTLKSFLTSFHFHLIFHRLVELFLEDVYQCCPALHLLDLFHFLTAFYISYWSVFVGCACLYRWVPWEQAPRFSNHMEYNITGTQSIIC